jgi:hypothetical protein
MILILVTPQFPVRLLLQQPCHLPFSSIVTSNGALSAFADLPMFLLGKKPTAVSKERVLANDLRDIFESHELSDVKLVCGDDRSVIPAHRAILAARSPFFLQLFKEVLQNISPSSLSSSSEFQKRPLQRQVSDSIPITAPRPSHIGDTPFITHTDLLEIPSASFHSSQSDSDQSWPGIEEEALTEIPLSQPHTPASNPSSHKPIPYDTKPSLANTSLNSQQKANEARNIKTPIIPYARLDHGILEIELPHIPYASLAPVIKYLYSMSLDLTTDNLVGVFSLAHDLGLTTLGPEILLYAPVLYSNNNIIDLLNETSTTPHCEPLLNSILTWLGADPSRSEALLKSPHLQNVPMDLIFRMMSMQLFQDEFEVYERFVESNGGEVEQILKRLNFQRMPPEQLLRVYKTGKVEDRIILDAFQTKLREGQLTYRVAGGSSILLEIPIFNESQRSPSIPRYSRGTGPLTSSSFEVLGGGGASSSASNFDHLTEGLGSSQSRTAISGISPASLIRRRSVAVTVPADIGDLVHGAVGSETWPSESFQVHSGNWSAIVKTRGGMLYKVGLVLNHTTTECDQIHLGCWSIVLESTSGAPLTFPINFSSTTFSMGKEVYKPVDASISTSLGFSMVAFQRASRRLLQIRVQFPIPSNITHHVIE